MTARPDRSVLRTRVKFLTFDSTSILVTPADYRDPVHAPSIVSLLDSYAMDPAGGGRPLGDFARAHLVAELIARPQAFSVLAFDTVLAVGLINCFEGFSTFACQSLVNIHDVVVLPGYRGRGIGSAMLELVEKIAAARGACKLTLEVLSGNPGAMKLYEQNGFCAYQLDPALGSAQFLQKWLVAPRPVAV
jgi:GNAT superfamily N-acetyltransferase